MDGDSEDVGRRVRDSLARIARESYEAAHGSLEASGARGTRWRLEPRVAASLALVLAVVVAVVYLASRPSGAGEPSRMAVTVEASSPALVVDVTGAVASPRVVDLPAGSRVRDAVAAAGGLADDADASSVNLARRLNDGEQVYVPREGEVEGAGGAVNVNRAGVAALETLPGIGPVYAERIVADRTRNGPFASLSDLARVPGIGASVVERLAGLATV